MKPEVTNPKTLGMEHLNDKFELAYNYEEIDDMGRRIIKQGDQEYLVRSATRSGLWEIFSANGSPIPLECQGYFTNIRAAEQALAQYASRKSNDGKIAKNYSKKLEDQGFFDKIVEEPTTTPIKKSKKKD